MLVVKWPVHWLNLIGFSGLPAIHQQDNTSSTTLELIIKDRAIWTETDECHDQNMG